MKLAPVNPKTFSPEWEKSCFSSDNIPDNTMFLSYSFDDKNKLKLSHYLKFNNQFYYFKDFQLAKNYKKNQLNTMQSINSFGSIAIMYIFLFSKDLLKKSEQFFYIISGNYRRKVNNED